MATTKDIPMRRLGKDGPLVPAMGLGLMGMSFFYGPPPSDEERFTVLDRALELGCTHWDSSDMYADSEELLGKWFARTGKRSQIFLATKFGIVPGVADFSQIDSSAAYCKRACALSLSRLGVDHIDLYYMHRANAATPIEETMRALAELRAEGKIRHIGLCEVSAATLRRACAVAPVDVLQCEYSPFELGIEGGDGPRLLATARELGVAVVAYSPLGRGMLTGAFTSPASLSADGDYRTALMPRFMPDNLAANVQVVERFAALAARKGCTSAQLALAFLMKQEGVVPIPGTKKIKYLEENWGALDVVLSDEEESEMRAFLEQTQMAGNRVPDSITSSMLVDTVEE